MYLYKCKVLNVVDGDTVDCEIDLGLFIKIVKRVRLYGINTPELLSTDLSERTSAKAAKDFLVNLAPSITSIKTVLDKGDKYGRLLGTFYTKYDADVNTLMITEGLAVSFLK